MLFESLKKIAHLLNSTSVPYMVIGGHATLYHGHPWFTEDIDIVLGVDEVQVSIVQIEDLIIYKMLAGRARYIEDLRVLFNKKKDELDLEVLESTLQELSNLLGNDNFLKTGKK